MKTENSNGQPYLGKLGAALVTGAVTTAIGLLVLTIYNAPQRADEKSIARDAKQEREIERDRAEIKSIRGILGGLQQDIAELRVTVEGGTGDRFTGAEARALRQLLDERELRVRDDVTGLKQEDQRQWDYAVQEGRRDK